MNIFYFFLYYRYVHSDHINVSNKPTSEKLEELGDSFCDIIYKSLKINFSLYIMDIESIHLQGISQNYKIIGKKTYL
jgi:hypothetical protein